MPKKVELGTGMHLLDIEEDSDEEIENIVEKGQRKQSVKAKAEPKAEPKAKPKKKRQVIVLQSESDSSDDDTPQIVIRTKKKSRAPKQPLPPIEKAYIEAEVEEDEDYYEPPAPQPFRLLRR